MLYRNLLIAGLVTSAVAITGCSKETEQAADAGAVEAAAESAGEDAVDNAQTAGAVATGAAVNAGEAIAEGANAAVEAAIAKAVHVVLLYGKFKSLTNAGPSTAVNPPTAPTKNAASAYGTNPLK